MASMIGPEAGIPSGCRPYAGPFFPRGFDDAVVSALDDTLPWFRYAAESAGPGRVHLAKVSISTNRESGWTRQLEIDGHETSHSDAEWPAGVASDRSGYLTRFAVFELPPAEVERRAEMDRTIRHFARQFCRSESVNALMDEMVRDGFDPDLVHETESISTLAWGRVLFEPRGVTFAPTITRARADGRVETDVPLLSIPAYTRARALSPEIREALGPYDFLSLCTYSAESNVILQAMEASETEPDFAGFELFSCVVPDREASQETIDAALQILQRSIDVGPPAAAPGRDGD